MSLKPYFSPVYPVQLFPQDQPPQLLPPLQEREKKGQGGRRMGSTAPAVVVPGATLLQRLMLFKGKQEMGGGDWRRCLNNKFRDQARRNTTSRQ